MNSSLDNGNIENADWLHLTARERIRWTDRPSWVTIVPAISGGIFAALLGVGLNVWLSSTTFIESAPSWVVYSPLLLTVIGIGQVIGVYLNWTRLLYVITDEEIYVKHGFLSRDVTQIRLDRVQNTAYNQSVLERILSFGDVKIYTAGSSTEDVTLRAVPDPEIVKQTVTHLLSESRSPQAGGF